MPPDELKLYFTLTRRAEAPQPVSPTEAAPLVFEPQMVKIPAGKFLMGSTEKQATQMVKVGVEKNWAEWEQPQHTVDLYDYSIGKYPITNREYEAFVRDAKHNPPQGWDGDQFPAEMGGHPVVNVSWDDANAYCRWLSEKTKKQYRLPTEAEWEKAARGKGENIYPWGNNFDLNKANTFEARLGGTSEVGQYSPKGDSPYGCADMAGNVWEWTSTLWGDDFLEASFKYPYNAEDGREYISTSIRSSIRILRGGCFRSHALNVRCATRFRREQVLQNNDVGFRVCVSPILKSEL